MLEMEGNLEVIYLNPSFRCVNQKQKKKTKNTCVEDGDQGLKD